MTIQSQALQQVAHPYHAHYGLLSAARWTRSRRQKTLAREWQAPQHLGAINSGPRRRNALRVRLLSEAVVEEIDDAEGGMAACLGQQAGAEAEAEVAALAAGALPRGSERIAEVPGLSLLRVCVRACMHACMHA